MPIEQDSFTSLGSFENFPASNPIIVIVENYAPWAMRTCLKLLQSRGITKQDLEKKNFNQAQNMTYNSSVVKVDEISTQITPESSFTLFVRS